MNNKPLSQCLRFRLALPTEKYMKYYQDNAQYIITRSLDNKNVKFPANAIRKFLTHDGVFGLFEIQFDENNKLISIKKLGA